MAEVAPDAALLVYGLDGSDACRKARNWLDRFGPPYQFVDTQKQRPEAASLKAWAAALGGWDALVDRGGSGWKGLLQQRRNPGSDPEWTLLIREHPDILRQPVTVVADGRVAVGFTGGIYERLLGKGKAK